MKNVIKVLALIAALGLSGAANAAPTTRPAGPHGKVQSVDGTTISIKSKAGDATIETDANTVFTLDGKPATLADVKAGERVVYATPETGVATQVKLVSGYKKKDKTPTTAPTN